MEARTMAMIVYAADHGRYMTMEEHMTRYPGEKRNLYVNLTNQCNCSCTFCLRGMKHMGEEETLWYHGKEPTVEMVKTALDAAPWDTVKEVVFCGFGEPTMRLGELVELLRYVRKTHPGIATRLNTNGLSDLTHGRDTSVDFAGLLDTVSISLNASNAERYLTLTRSRFGIGSFEAMLTFARHCKAYVPQVVLTVVDHVESSEEIRKCRQICEERGLTLRVRPYEDH